MNRVRTIILIFSILSFTLIVNAQEDYDFYLQKARQRLAEGDCTRAEISYNSYKDIAHKTNKEIERLIEECKNGGSSSLGDDLTFTYNGHEYVDLGLPSGTMWATCNVGATTPEGCGDYFAWGETKPKSIYGWDTTYKYCNVGESEQLTKYCNDFKYGYHGFTDTFTVLQSGDDAATANWGNGWCMPTKEQWEELYGNTTCIWKSWDGVNGLLFSGKNGAVLFLPAAGHHGSRGLGYVGSDGEYWSSSLQTGDSRHAWVYYFRSDDYYMTYYGRVCGLVVRAVRSTQ